MSTVDLRDYARSCAWCAADVTARGLEGEIYRCPECGRHSIFQPVPDAGIQLRRPREGELLDDRPFLKLLTGDAEYRKPTQIAIDDEDAKLRRVDIEPALDPLELFFDRVFPGWRKLRP